MCFNYILRCLLQVTSKEHSTFIDTTIGVPNLVHTSHNGLRVEFRDTVLDFWVIAFQFYLILGPVHFPLTGLSRGHNTTELSWCQLQI
jgi:hypothetical protein